MPAGLRIPAHRPHQVLVHDALVVDQHAVGDRVVVADDRVHELVDEGVRLEPERLYRKRHHRREKGRTGHIGVLGEPRFETARDALRLRHSADTGGMLHHPLAFGDRELTEQEEAFARSGGDPVGVAAASIEKCRLCCSRSLLGEFDQLVFNLERAQRLEFSELH